jgi:hypothetical protein
MNNNNLLLYGAVAVGAIFLYNRYTKKPMPQGEEPQNGGGGGGGGGFPVGPIGPLPIIPSTPNVVVVNPVTPRGSVVTPTTPKNPIVLSGLGGARPQVNASTSSTSVGAMSGVGVSNTGGIVPISQGGSTTPRQTGSVVQISKADLNKGVSGGMVFKPFDGGDGRLRLENLVRSWNRP